MVFLRILSDFSCCPLCEGVCLAYWFIKYHIYIYVYLYHSSNSHVYKACWPCLAFQSLISLVAVVQCRPSGRRRIIYTFCTAVHQREASVAFEVGRLTAEVQYNCENGWLQHTQSLLLLFSSGQLVLWSLSSRTGLWPRSLSLNNHWIFLNHFYIFSYFRHNESTLHLISFSVLSSLTPTN